MAIHDNINARSASTALLRPPEKEVTLDMVNAMAADIDDHFGDGAAWQLLARLQPNSRNISTSTLWSGGYRTFVQWGRAALRLNVHPASNEWTTDMIWSKDND